MGRWLSRGSLGAVVLIGITVKWSSFNSTILPYTISQPSTFAHQVATMPGGQQVDFFFASGLGSYTTNVNISAQRSSRASHALSILQNKSRGNPKQTSWIKVMGHKLRVIRTVHPNTLAGTYIVEQVSFPARGYIWTLTASYDPRFKSLLPTMLRMLSSFNLR